MEEIIQSDIAVNILITASVIITIIVLSIIIKVLYKYKIAFVISLAIFIVGYFTLIHNVNDISLINISIASSLISIILGIVAIFVSINSSIKCDKNLKTIAEIADMIMEEGAKFDDGIKSMKPIADNIKEQLVKYNSIADRIEQASDISKAKMDCKSKTVDFEKIDDYLLKNIL